MVETDEFLSTNLDGFVMDSVTITTAYSKMKNLCSRISNEIQADIKIHNQHILPRYVATKNKMHLTSICWSISMIVLSCISMKFMSS